MDSQLNAEDKNDIEDVSDKFNDVFAGHRLDIGVNAKFKIKLTPKIHQPEYKQSLHCTINLKEDLTVVLALMQNYAP